MKHCHPKVYSTKSFVVQGFLVIYVYSIMLILNESLRIFAVHTQFKQMLYMSTVHCSGHCSVVGTVQCGEHSAVW